MSITSHIVRTLFTIGDLKRDIGWKKPGNVDSVENLSYGQDDKLHLLDVYRPRKASGTLPVIINIHGGAWVYGDKKVYAPYCMYLASRGFAVVNASYRLAPRYTLFLLRWKMWELWWSGYFITQMSMASIFRIFSLWEILQERIWRRRIRPFS